MNTMPLQDSVEGAAEPVPKYKKAGNRKFRRGFFSLLGLLALALWAVPRQANTIGAGEAHSLGVRADGTVVAWGLNDSGQCTVPAGLNQVVAVAAGDDHSLALKSDGTVVAWGAVKSRWDLTIVEYSFSC